MPQLSRIGYLLNGSILSGGVSYPSPTGLASLGDSRIQLSVGLPGTGTAIITSIGNGHGYAGALYNVIDNAVRSSMGYNRGVTTSTSRSAEFRLASASIAATGNPANTDTGISADLKYSVAALGDYSIVDDPANLVFFMGLINDIGVGYFTTDGGGSNPLGIMKSAARIFDSLGTAGKQVFVGETPKGKSTTLLEGRSPTLSGGFGVFSASSTTGFVDAADFPTPIASVITSGNVVLTKVANNPASGQYSVSGGNYTVDAALVGTNTVFINYASGSTSQTTAAMLDVNEWLQSTSASPFVAPTSGTSYAIAGARYDRSYVHYVDTWGALIDSGTGDAKNGLLSDGLHPGHAGVTTAAAAFRTAFLSVYPAQTTSLRTPPTVGNFECGNSGGATHYHSAPSALGGAVQLPSTVFNTSSPPAASTCRFTYGPTTSAGPTVITCTDIGGGLYRLADNTGGTIVDASKDSSTQNVIDTTTGHWDLWLKSASGGRIYFERDFTNFVPNALFNTDHGTGTKSAVISGVEPSGTTTSQFGNWTISSSDTGLSGTPTMTVAISAGTEPTTGKTALIVDINGLAGTGGGVLISSANSPIANRVIPANSDRVVAEGYLRVEPGTNGHLYGLNSAHNRISFSVGGSATRGAYTNVSSIGCDTGIGTAGFPMTAADLSSGAFIFKALSAPVDMSSPITITAPSFQFSLQYQPSKPVSARVYITEAALRTI